MNLGRHVIHDDSMGFLELDPNRHKISCDMIFSQGLATRLENGSYTLAHKDILNVLVCTWCNFSLITWKDATYNDWTKTETYQISVAESEITKEELYHKEKIYRKRHIKLSNGPRATSIYLELLVHKIGGDNFS
jgi:hypothetical protein